MGMMGWWHKCGKAEAVTQETSRVAARIDEAMPIGQHGNVVGPKYFADRCC